MTGKPKDPKHAKKEPRGGDATNAPMYQRPSPGIGGAIHRKPRQPHKPATAKKPKGKGEGK